MSSPILNCQLNLIFDSVDLIDQSDSSPVAHTGLLFTLVIPILNGILVAMASGWITDVEGNRLLFAILAASASYIAVPAAMKLAVPKAKAGLYIPMALAITFPLNITLGMPSTFRLFE